MFRLETRRFWLRFRERSHNKFLPRGIDAFALIEAGYDVNYSDRDGITPLMAATEKDDTKLVRILLECGARAMEKDKRGRTALDRVRDPEMQNVFRCHGNVSADSRD
jgi:ankyrin repeat protein